MSAKKNPKKAVPQTTEKRSPSRTLAVKKTKAKESDAKPKRTAPSKKAVKKSIQRKSATRMEAPLTKSDAEVLLGSTSGRMGLIIKEVMLPILIPIAKELGPRILKEVLDAAIRSAKNPIAKQGLSFLKRILF